MFSVVQNSSVLFNVVQYCSFCPKNRAKVLKKNWNLKENEEKMHFFSKIFGHVKKKQYLCTRFRKGSHG